MLPVCSWQPFYRCLPTEEKWSLVGVVRCFWRVLENYDCLTKFNGLCWNIDSRKIIWPPRAHFGSENESLKGLKTLSISLYVFVSTHSSTHIHIMINILKLHGKK